MNRLRPYLTYPHLVSTLALFVALGGTTAFAAGQLGARSVGERQLRPGAVTAEKIRKNAVTAPKIKALAVKNGKLAGGAVSEAKLATAAVTNGKLADGAVTTAKIGPDAVTGSQVQESTLGQVPSAATAGSAAFADSANPAAFAAVDENASVDASLSKGIGPGDVKAGKEGGIYCLTVPGLSPRGAQVTPAYNGSGQTRAFVTIGGAPECPAPAVEVRTYNNVGLVKAPFYVVLYR